MGRRDRLKNPIIHRRKLFNGWVTAEELHAKLAWGNARCSACGGPPAIRIQVFLPLADMSAATRMEIEFQMALRKLHTVPTTSGPAIRASVMHACKRCQPALERAAARGGKGGVPSFAIVDIDRGPGVDKPIVGVL